MATVSITRASSQLKTARQFREFMAGASVTLFGLLILSIFLTPLAYMTTSAFKTIQQILDLKSGILPMSPITYNYEGQDYPLYNVPSDNGLRQWALIEKGREDSQFIDPANLAAGSITWAGRWRTLDPVYRLNPTADNFPTAWDTVKFGILFRNTFIIAFAGTVGTVLSSIAVAYGFSRFRFPGKGLLFMLLVSTIMLPTQITLIPQYVFFRNVLGWGGTWWPLIIPYFFANAYNVFLLRQYFRSIPKDLDEAAMIDGATPLQTLIRVIVPQSWPAITAVAMFNFFFQWNDFFTPLVYLQGYEDRYPIAVGLTQFANAFGTRPELLMAASIMALALPVVIFFMAQRIFMQGIVFSGVEK